MTGSSFASVNIRNSRILVVDDNRVNRHLLVAVLQRGGFPNVGTAEDGIDALAKIEEGAPDLILLDLMMPRMDGFEVCRQVRANPAWRDLPILVQSSLSGSEDRKHAFSAGATDFVTKPINATELLSRVRIHLENQALLRDLAGLSQPAPDRACAGAQHAGTPAAAAVASGPGEGRSGLEPVGAFRTLVGTGRRLLGPAARRPRPLDRLAGGFLRSWRRCGAQHLQVACDPAPDGLEQFRSGRTFAGSERTGLSACCGTASSRPCWSAWSIRRPTPSITHPPAPRRP